jgi:Fe-S-cluster-containing dehydrogenase component
MSKIAMFVDLDRCVGCFACQNACKMVNNLPDGVVWLRVTPKEHKPEVVDGELVMDRFPVPISLDKCAVCPDRENGNQPLCASVCMGKALWVGDAEKAFKLASKARAVVYTKDIPEG